MGLRPYQIVSPPYAHFCGGIRALYRLAEELQARGVPAQILGSYNPEAITVYPEIVTDNPYGSARVVRWLLNRADVPDDGLKFAWADGMDAPLLTVDIIETDLFYPRTGPRNGTAFWVHKGNMASRFVPSGSRQITHGWPATRPELAELLGSIDYLISFDPFTAMVPEALLCGTPVLIPTQGAWTRAEIESHGWVPYGVAWSLDELDQARATVHLAFDHYQNMRREFARRIDAFIDSTQTYWE